MSYWLLTVILFILFTWLFESYLTIINSNSQPAVLPVEFQTIFDQDKYQRSLSYQKENTKCSILSNSISTILTLVLLLVGGFNIIDQYARSFQYNSTVTGLIFFAIIAIIYGAISFPFTIWTTFKIEQKYGFNRTTVKTFILDNIKGLILGAIIGGALLAMVLWFFQATGYYAWVYCWIATIAFSFIMQLVAPTLIMPLFNKFSPIEDGSLKDKIASYADKQGFKLKGIYVMDSSKRSTKLNAFFTGFGRFRKVVLFDTLIEKLSEDELLSVLAHEIGHAKCNHIFKGILLSTIQTGLIFYLLSLIINRHDFTLAFMNEYSIYASLFFFAYLLSPTNFIISIIVNKLSRKNEYEADNFAAKTVGTGQHLISALKKLAGENMANLSPHPLYVKFYYSHPPLRDRFDFLTKIENKLK